MAMLIAALILRNSKRGGMATHAGVALELGIHRPSGKLMSPQMEAILIWCQCRVRNYVSEGENEYLGSITEIMFSSFDIAESEN